MNDSQRYGSLRDYLRVVSTQRWLVLLITFIAAGTALGLSLSQEKTYEATAAMTFQDVSQDVNLLGASVPARDAPAVLAAQSAATVKRSDVVALVQRDLRTTLAADDLRDRLVAAVDPQTNLVRLTADADDPQIAADIANSFARQTQLVFDRQAKARFTRAARDLSRRLREERRTLDADEELVFKNQIARLESLSTFARSVTIAEFARPDDTPISPKPVISTIFGLFVGLVLGLVFAFIRDALDRRLRTASDVRSHLDLPILGHVRTEALGRSVFNPKNRKKGMQAVDLEAYRIMRRNLEFLNVDKPAHVVVVTSALPAEGKSTVAASLAVAAAQSGRSVLLLESDLRRPTLAERLGGAASPGVSDYLVGEAEPGRVVQPLQFDEGAVVAPDGTTGSVIGFVSAGSPSPDPAQLLGSKRFEQLLTDVRDVYDLVIVDSCPVLPVVDTLEFLPLVDAVILCVRVGQTTRDQAHAALTTIQRLPERPIGVVVTGTKASDDSAYGSYGNTYAYSAPAGAGR